MATVVKRNKKYYVVYNYLDAEGNRKQKWESKSTMREAQSRKKEVEYKKQIGTFTVPSCTTVDELLQEYVDLYGKNTWALSTYQSNVSLIKHYISPVIGKMKLCNITTRVIEQYYQQMLHYKAVKRAIGTTQPENVSSTTVRSLHKLLRSCFSQAVKWDLMVRNPCELATVPKSNPKERDIWTADQIFHALEVCQDKRLKLAISLAFAASLRIGELLALTWDCIDITPESIANGYASIYINKELQRVNRQLLNTLERKDVQLIFPALNSKTITLQVLKEPKTQSSIRKVFLPTTVANELVEWKKGQDEVKEALGSEYNDYGLVFAGFNGMPTEAVKITTALHKLIEENEDLPPIVFHSLRHSSITYKLKLNGGNIKAVQGDSGHAQANMVMDVYSHILDEDRRRNAQLFEEAFYLGSDSTTKSTMQDKLTETLGSDTLEKILQNPELAALVKALAEKI